MLYFYNISYARCANIYIYFLLRFLSFSSFSSLPFKLAGRLWASLSKTSIPGFYKQLVVLFLLFVPCLGCVIIFKKSLQMKSYLFSGSLSSSSSSTVTGTDLDKASSPWGKKKVHLKLSFKLPTQVKQYKIKLKA